MALVPRSFREHLIRFCPSYFQAPVAQRFIMATLGVPADATVEASAQALVMPWIKEPDRPRDAVALTGEESNMERYPGETLEQFHARLKGRWNAWEFAGDETAIESQLAAAGWPGAEVWTPKEIDAASPAVPDDSPLDINADPWWSRFYVYFPFGTHPGVTPGSTYGSFNWGDGTLWGLGGITEAQLTLICGIVKKWKPADWAFLGILFEQSDSSLTRFRC